MVAPPPDRRRCCRRRCGLTTPTQRDHYPPRPLRATPFRGARRASACLPSSGRSFHHHAAPPRPSVKRATSPLPPVDRPPFPFLTSLPPPLRLPSFQIIMCAREDGLSAMDVDNDADLQVFARPKTARDLFFLDRGFRPDGSRLGALRPDTVEERDTGTLRSTAVRVIACLVAPLRSLTRCRTIDRVFGYSFRPMPLQYEGGSTASTNLSPYSIRTHTRSVRRNQATYATTQNGSSTTRLRRPDNRSASSTVRSAMLKARIITRTLIGLALRQPVRHSRSSTRMVYRTVRHPTLLFRPSPLPQPLPGPASTIGLAPPHALRAFVLSWLVPNQQYRQSYNRLFGTVFTCHATFELL